MSWLIDCYNGLVSKSKHTWIFLKTHKQGRKFLRWKSLELLNASCHSLLATGSKRLKLQIQNWLFLLINICIRLGSFEPSCYETPCGLQIERLLIQCLSNTIYLSIDLSIYLSIYLSMHIYFPSYDFLILFKCNLQVINFSL